MDSNSPIAERFASSITHAGSEAVSSEFTAQTTAHLPQSGRPEVNASRRMAHRQPFFLRAMVLAGLVILFLWPALWNRGPFYFLDTRTYIRSADAAINKITHTRTDWTADDDSAASAKGSQAAPAAEQKLYDIGQAKTRSLGEITKKGIMLGRSIYWGLLLYVGSVTGGFWLTIAVQSASILLAIYLTLRTLRFPAWPTLVFVSIGLALLSDAAFFSSLLLPDLFAGFAILGCAVLIAVQRRMGRTESAAWFLFLLGALLCHDSCILIAASLLGVAVIANLLRRSWRNWRGLCIVLLALMTASAGQFLVAYGIGRATHQAPLRFPMLEARLIADGPGTRYLRATCPQNHFTLCEYAGEFPISSEEFLYGTAPGKSVYEVATYERRRQLSAEQLRFALAVLRYDPMGVLRTGLQNTWTQFLSFKLSNFNYDASFNDKMERTFPEGVLAQIRATTAYREAMPVAALSILLYLFVIGSLVYLLLVQLKMLPKRSMPDLLKRMFLWGFAGLILNAAISGGISLPESRYQARAIWIIPLFALLAESQRWIDRWGDGSLLSEKADLESKRMQRGS